MVRGSSQIRVTLAGKEDRREAKYEQLGSVSQSSCYSCCSSRSGSKSLPYSFVDGSYMYTLYVGVFSSGV